MTQVYYKDKTVLLLRIANNVLVMDSMKFLNYI
jgi:hypothetical protein